MRSIKLSAITKTILIFGSISVIVLLLFLLEQWSLLALGGSGRYYSVIIATIFLILGLGLSRYIFLRRTFKKRQAAQNLLTSQEMNVLQLIAEGKSNGEIAQDLFIAETTVKSHVSNILSKLNAKRRTEAIKIGRDLEII